MIPRRYPNGRPPCRFDGCEEKSAKSCKGWCPKHYARWKRHGDPAVVKSSAPEFQPVMPRLMSRVVNVDGCLYWQGAMMPNGYGRISVNGRAEYAHRAAWVSVNGPVPAGKHLHHTCENRACVNPAHLVPVDPDEHQRHHVRARKAVAA